MSAGRFPPLGRRALAAVAVGSLLAMVAACGAGAQGSAASGTGPSPRSAHGAGTVRVLYAGSLVNLMERHLGPAFDAATGDRFLGYGAGSTQIANEIKGRVRRGDVFISADPGVNARLRGTANGNWVSWYVSFARSPLVLGYNPKSRFAHQLATRQWYDVIAQPGFRLGRTDPTLDPKGRLTARAISQIAAERHSPALARAILRNAQVFPEEELAGRLQAGQLDAGFFYSVETSDLHLPTVPLQPLHLGATYTATVLSRAQDRAAGVQFVRYLLTARGRVALRAHGLIAVPVTLTGPAAAVPAALRAAVTGRR